jgi:hypothetical protein
VVLGTVYLESRVIVLIIDAEHAVLTDERKRTPPTLSSGAEPGGGAKT